MTVVQRNLSALPVCMSSWCTNNQAIRFHNNVWRSRILASHGTIFPQVGPLTVKPSDRLVEQLWLNDPMIRTLPQTKQGTAHAQGLTDAPVYHT